MELGLADGRVIVSVSICSVHGQCQGVFLVDFLKYMSLCSVKAAAVRVTCRRVRFGKCLSLHTTKGNHQEIDDSTACPASSPSQHRVTAVCHPWVHVCEVHRPHSLSEVFQRVSFHISLIVSLSASFCWSMYISVCTCVSLLSCVELRRVVVWALPR